MSLLKIDPSRCEGHGRCYDIAPNLFATDDYGHGRVIPVTPNADIDANEARQAAAACPEHAITFEP